MAAAMGGWRRGVVLSCRRTALLSYYPSGCLRHASSSAAASPCIASTLYDPTRKGPPTDEMLAFMEKLRSSGGSSGTVRLDMHRVTPLHAFLPFPSLHSSLLLEHRSSSLAATTTTESWSWLSTIPRAGEGWEGMFWGHGVSKAHPRLSFPSNPPSRQECSHGPNDVDPARHHPRADDGEDSKQVQGLLRPHPP